MSEREILAAIRDGAGSVAEIGATTEAGTGCQSCHEALLQLLQDETRRELARDRAPNPLRQLSLFESSGVRRPGPPRGAHRRDS